MYRNSLFALALFVGSCALNAQDNPLSTELKAMYTPIKTNWTKMAEKMPEENYGFKPTADIRNFGQMVAHVADSQARTCTTLTGDVKSVDAASKTSKGDLVAALKQSFAYCDAAFDALTDATGMQTVKTPRGQRTKFGALAALVSHSNEEYGYTSVYLRLKAVVPPSSETR